MLEAIKNEPVLLASLVAAAIDCAIVFGAPLSVEQKTAIIAFANAAIALATRQFVTPTRKLKD